MATAIISTEEPRQSMYDMAVISESGVYLHCHRRKAELRNDWLGPNCKAKCMGYSPIDWKRLDRSSNLGVSKGPHRNNEDRWLDTCPLWVTCQDHDVATVRRITFEARVGAQSRRPVGLILIRGSNTI